MASLKDTLVTGTLAVTSNTTLTGDLTVNGGDIILGGTGRIQGIDTVSASTDAVNKGYVDNITGGKVPKVACSDNSIVKFNGTTGDIQNSGCSINDSNYMVAAKYLANQGDIAIGGYGFSADAGQDTGMYSTGDGVLQLKANNEEFFSRGASSAFVDVQPLTNWDTATLGLYHANGHQPSLSFWAQSANSAGIIKFYGPGSRFEIRNSNESGFIGIFASEFVVASDYRLKENIKEINSGSIDKIKLLKPCTFNFINDMQMSYGKKTVTGFIAHEMAEVIPEAVFGEKDAERIEITTDEDGNETEIIKPEYQGIDQSKIVPLLTSALKEAIARIEALELSLENHLKGVEL